MLNLIGLARQKGFSEVQLNAQTGVLDFYRALGFEICGEEFTEAGIPHRRMRLRL
jgi:predicted GNAT family N-acyltransferase